MGWLPPFAQNAKGWRTKLSSRSLCQHERGTLTPTSSGTESRGEEGPHHTYQLDCQQQIRG